MLFNKKIIENWRRRINRKRNNSKSRNRKRSGHLGKKKKIKNKKETLEKINREKKENQNRELWRKSIERKRNSKGYPLIHRSADFACSSFSNNPMTIFTSPLSAVDSLDSILRQGFLRPGTITTESIQNSLIFFTFSFLMLSSPS